MIMSMIRTLQMSGEQIRLQFPPKLFGVNS